MDVHFTIINFYYHGVMRLIVLYRSRKEYIMLLAGVWCALQKSPCLSFLEPVMKRLKHLAEAGNISIKFSASCLNRVFLYA